MRGIEFSVGVAIAVMLGMLKRIAGRTRGKLLLATH